MSFETEARETPSLKKTWENIKSRCYNPKNGAYARYGGRGIGLAPEWLHDRGAFESWINQNLGTRPESYTLDRIDNDGNYEPGNLRWASASTQNTNTRLSCINKSGYRGVHRHKRKYGWRVSIIVEGTKVTACCFKDPEEAAWTYDQFAIALRGDNTKLNFVYGGSDV